MMESIRKISLANKSSLKIGGVGNYIVVSNKVDLISVSKYAALNNLKIYTIGEGTNSYFSDNLSKYLFLGLNFKGIKVVKEDKSSSTLEVGASENWHKLVLFTIRNGLWGIENLSLIPGSAGAAPVQNIGAYGVELKDVLDSVKVYDLKYNKLKTLKKKVCDFSYRDSIFKKEEGRYIILYIKIKLSKVRVPILDYKPLDKLKKIEGKVDQKKISNLIIKTRRQKLPDYKKIPNCGSFFKNPIVSRAKLNKIKKQHENIYYFETLEGIKVSAAWLIENVAKMKGFKTKNFQISPNQALVITNTGKGDAKELNSLVKDIKNRIFEKIKIKLEQEVNFIK